MIGLIKFYKDVSIAITEANTFKVYYNDSYGYICEFEFKNKKQAEAKYNKLVAQRKKLKQLDLFK